MYLPGVNQKRHWILPCKKTRKTVPKKCSTLIPKVQHRCTVGIPMLHYPESYCPCWESNQVEEKSNQVGNQVEQKSNEVEDLDTGLRHSNTDLDTGLRHSDTDLDTRLRHSGTNLDTDHDTFIEDHDTIHSYHDTKRVPLTNKQKDIVNFCSVPRTSREILERAGVVYHTKNIAKYITSLVAAGYLQMTNPDNPAIWLGLMSRLDCAIPSLMNTALRFSIFEKRIKPLEFDGVKTWIIQFFSYTEKLYRIAVSHPFTLTPSHLPSPLKPR